MKRETDLIIIGAGASGLMAAISAARRGRRVLLLEKLPRVGRKLRASGGGRCNLTNTLEQHEFMRRFGREGRFMQDALLQMDTPELLPFFQSIGVPTHFPDGMHVFPESHDAKTVVDGLLQEVQRLDVEVRTGTAVTDLRVHQGELNGVRTAAGDEFRARSVLIATGGQGYPELGTTGDGYALAAQAGHRIMPVWPGMLPLQTQENWVTECRADTVPRVLIRIQWPEARQVQVQGDLIFTRDGIAGPVVLDLAREVTPLLDRHGTVPLQLQLIPGLNEAELRRELTRVSGLDSGRKVLDTMRQWLPVSVARALCRVAGAEPTVRFRELPGPVRDRLPRILARTKLTVTGHGGFGKAMVTRGGVRLREVNPRTLQSRLLPGLYFSGEVLDLDGPCGGFNLRWAFASGWLAGLRIDSTR